jgi:hypothetical protein
MSCYISSDRAPAIYEAADRARELIVEVGDEPALRPVLAAIDRVLAHAYGHIDGRPCAGDSPPDLSVAYAAARVELERLARLERRLQSIVRMDPEIREHRRVWETDELGAILGVLDRTRDERARLELDQLDLERERDEARARLEGCEERARILEWQRDLQHRRVRRLAADLAETEAERRAAWGDR